MDNIGTLDRFIRAALGLALAIWGIATENWFGALAVIPLGTALVGWCPLYARLGLCTRPRESCS
ncbi:YgaP family membrane protein [Caldichromatium japonicum]|nr:DUF2892 domain-containing protein [Caldichromatium japonicum]